MNEGARRVLGALLEARTGQQLAANRAWRLEVALAPVLRERGLASTDELATRIVAGADATLETAVVEALLNNETYFFRDASAFQVLSEALHAAMIARGGAERRVRIWCAGCSTGQEVYSLAMLFGEPASPWRGWATEFVGTDISGAAIAQAREGLYSQFEIQRGLPVRQMVRWFDKDGDSWRASTGLRTRVRFRRAGLAGPPPAPGRFDAILCRNVLLYFSPEARLQILDRLADALSPGGVLMLGAGETVLGQTDRFASDPDYRGLYRLAAEPDAAARSAGSASGRLG